MLRFFTHDNSSSPCEIKSVFFIIAPFFLFNIIYLLWVNLINKACYIFFHDSEISFNVPVHFSVKKYVLAFANNSTMTLLQCKIACLLVKK